MHVDCSCLNIRRCFPYHFEQKIPRLNSTSTLRQQQKQLELRRRQIDFTSVHGYAMGRAIDAQRSDLSNFLGVFLTGLYSSQDRADAEDQFLRTERFGQIVVGTEREPL